MSGNQTNNNEQANPGLLSVDHIRGSGMNTVMTEIVKTYGKTNLFDIYDKVERGVLAQFEHRISEVQLPPTNTKSEVLQSKATSPSVTTPVLHQAGFLKPTAPDHVEAPAPSSETVEFDPSAFPPLKQKQKENQQGQLKHQNYDKGK